MQSIQEHFLFRSCIFVIITICDLAFEKLIRWNIIFKHSIYKHVIYHVLYRYILNINVFKDYYPADYKLVIYCESVEAGLRSDEKYYKNDISGHLYTSFFKRSSRSLKHTPSFTYEHHLTIISFVPYYLPQYIPR